METPAAIDGTLQPHHLEDLRRSGLTDETIHAAKIRSVTRDEAHSILGFDPRAGGIAFPYPSLNGFPDTTHVKPDEPYRGEDGKPRKYLAPKDATNRLYIPSSISVPTLQNKRIPLWITEGEKKALKAAQEGLACVALSGVWNWRFRDHVKDSRTIPDFGTIWLKGRKVLICFDSDTVTNRSVRWAEYKLAEKLRELGAEVCAVRLPAGPTGEKVGLDDFLVAHPVADLDALPRDPLTEPPTTTSTTAGQPDPPVPSLADLLDEVAAFIRRYVVLNADQLTVVALWTAHTHAIDAAEATPFLGVTSPEKGSGKTRLLEILALVVRCAWHAVAPSEAVLFRRIDRDRPTLLLDEIDGIFGPKAGEHEGLRSLLNSGNRRGTVVSRCVGKSFDLRDFAVFCPRAIAGIGNLPDTIADRSIPIRMTRRTRDERVASFGARQRRDAEAEAGGIRKVLERWAEQNVEALKEARPEIPAILSDRAQDGAEPLLAIADAAGGVWPVKARAAFGAVYGVASADSASVGVRLLKDIRDVLGPADRIASSVLCENLADIEDAPWGDWYGKPITPRILADRLKGFDIRPGTVRLDGTKTAKGYHQTQFEDAWRRYLPAPEAPDTSKTGFDPSHPSQVNGTNGLRGLFDPSHEGLVTAVKNSANQHPEPLVTGVTDKTAPEGNGEDATLDL